MGNRQGEKTNTRPGIVEAAENRLMAFKLRKTGLSYPEIGKQLGCSKQNAHKLVRTELESIRTETAEEAKELRTLELERLDTMLIAIWAQALRGNLLAIDRVLKIIDARAKLLGTYAPEKKAFTDPSGENEWSPELAKSKLAMLLGVDPQDLPE